VTFLSDWAWLLLPIGLFGSVIGWMLCGLFLDFEDAQSRTDWMWAGIMAGALLSVMWVILR